MRIKTIVGLSFAGAVAAVAVAGGVAYAADDTGSSTGTTVKIVEDGDGARDCPEKDGSAPAQENL